MGTTEPGETAKERAARHGRTINDKQSAERSRAYGRTIHKHVLYYESSKDLCAAEPPTSHRAAFRNGPVQSVDRTMISRSTRIKDEL